MYDTDHLSDKDIFLLIISTDEYDCISLVLNYVNSAFLLRSSHDRPYLDLIKAINMYFKICFKN